MPEGAGPVTYPGMAAVVGVVDGTWYSVVSFLVGHTGLARACSTMVCRLNRITACFSLFVAGLAAWQSTAQFG